MVTAKVEFFDSAEISEVFAILKEEINLRTRGHSAIVSPISGGLANSSKS
jgi:hypothetical protein